VIIVPVPVPYRGAGGHPQTWGGKGGTVVPPTWGGKGGTVVPPPKSDIFF